MMSTILQFCAPSKGFGDYLKDFNFWDALACQYADPLGFYVFGLLVYTGVALPIYIRTNSMTIPAVLLLIVGGVVTPQVAGVATPFTTLIVAGSLAGSIAMLYYSYGR